MLSTNVFNELCVKITPLRSIPKTIITVCNAVYLRLCIDLMHITPPVTAEEYDGSHHPRCAEWNNTMQVIMYIYKVESRYFAHQWFVVLYVIVRRLYIRTPNHCQVTQYLSFLESSMAYLGIEPAVLKTSSLYGGFTSHLHKLLPCNLQFKRLTQY